jgi:hypothetical protein
MKTALAVFTVLTLPLLVAAQEPSDTQKRPQEDPLEKHGGNATEEERFAQLKRQMQELHRAGKHEEAERLSKELHAAWEKHEARIKAHQNDEPKKRPEDEHHALPGGSRDRAPERYRHLQEAIRHLRAAGLNDARDLENAAAKLRESFDGDRHHRDLERGGHDAAAHEHDAQAARAYEETHRGDIAPESRRNDSRTDAVPLREMHRQLQEIREEMQKMAREMRELREQARRP